MAWRIQQLLARPTLWWRCVCMAFGIPDLCFSHNLVVILRHNSADMGLVTFTGLMRCSRMCIPACRHTSPATDSCHRRTFNMLFTNAARGTSLCHSKSQCEAHQRQHCSRWSSSRPRRLSSLRSLSHLAPCTCGSRGTICGRPENSNAWTASAGVQSMRTSRSP